MSVPVVSDFEHGAKLSTVEKHPDIKLSNDVLDHLQKLGLNHEEVLKRPVTYAPPVDDSHPLPSYFVSSSHNTYLLAHQLYGSTNPISYSHVISKHCRCVEIDAWDSPDGPKVTHGWTLTKATSFKSVCEAIVAPIKDDSWPVMVSLECHAGHKGQLEMVRLMKEIWGHRLVASKLEGVDDTNITPAHLKGRIVLIVEYHNLNPVGNSDSSSSSSDDDDGRPSLIGSILNRKRENPKHKPHPPICDELAALGIYANSIKPHGNFLLAKAENPVNYLINISESAMSKLFSTSIHKLIHHGTKHQCRVYPKGIRIGSNNLDPLKYWRAGAQIAALNWQNFDKGMQLNNAMFQHSNGWVLKPESFLRYSKDGKPLVEKPKGKTRLTCEIFGASRLPRPVDVETNETLNTYIRAELMHSSKTFTWRSKNSKGPAVDDKLGMNPVWNDHLEWMYDQEELVFLRILVVEDKFGIDKPFAIFCARVDYLQSGWRLVKLLDLSGQETGSTILLNFNASQN